MSQTPVADRQFDLFVPLVADMPLRDQRETLERPFFRLSKNKRLKPIEYTSPDQSVYVNVFPNQEFGMATIWDPDILIWAASTLCELKRTRANDIPRTLNFQPYDLLKTIRRDSGGRQYKLLRESLARLQATTIRTNIRADKARRKERQFGWIESFTDVIDEQTKTSKGMSITLSDWFYEGVIMDGGGCWRSTRPISASRADVSAGFTASRASTPAGQGSRAFPSRYPPCSRNPARKEPIGASSSRSSRSSARAAFPALVCALRTKSRANRRSS
jgi:hypothetical protein